MHLLQAMRNGNLCHTYCYKSWQYLLPKRYLLQFHKNALWLLLVTLILVFKVVHETVFPSKCTSKGTTFCQICWLDECSRILFIKQRKGYSVQLCRLGCIRVYNFFFILFRTPPPLLFISPPPPPLPLPTTHAD